MNTIEIDEETIFHAARRMTDPEARSAYLEAHCETNPALRRRLERLLSVCEQEADFLINPSARRTIDVPRAEVPLGTIIGPYRLIEQIAEGGMGVVYLAEQGQPLRRKVALKIIKLGMDTKQIIARFEAERQTLALMDHPNIARVLDGGATDSGRPYFVMELVCGVPITEYCDRARLSIRDRLDLFVLVCRAVQHAHLKGIIHRDLKPSNVLVTEIDGVAVPKVIDFGVAKAIGGPLSDSTLYTGFHQMIGTPLYMSPEQADLLSSDVDTRSDVYALGVLLYELLTGTTPFDPETFQKAAYPEVCRILREVEPPRPSTRLSSLGTRLALVSANCQADVRPLDKAVRGELDWIVMKALEKDRRRRYETANDFAADVMRYLTDQPVEACPSTNWYRFSKYARRHRVALSTSSLVLMSLVGGLGASVWQAVRATAAEGRSIANQQAAEDHLVLGFEAVDELYQQVAMRWLGDLRWGVPLPRPFLEKTLPFYEKFVESRRVNPIAGRAHKRIGEILIQLRRFPEAESALARAEAIFSALLAVDSENPEYLRYLAECHSIQTDLPGSWDRRLPALQKAIALRKQLCTRFPNVMEDSRDLAASYQSLASYSIFGRHADGMDPLERARAIREQLARDHPTDDDLLCDLATTYRSFSEYHQFAQRFREAEPYAKRALALHEELLARHPTRPRYLMEVTWDHVNLGPALANTFQYDELMRVSNRAVSLCHGLSSDYPEAAQFRELEAKALGLKLVALAQTGQRAECDMLLARLQELVNDKTRAGVLAQIAWYQVHKEPPRRADPTYPVELATRSVALDPDRGFAWHVLGIAHYRAAQWDEAIAALKKANALEQGSGLGFHGFFLAMAHHRKGDLEQGRAWFDRSVDWMTEHHPWDAELRRRYAESAAVFGLPVPRDVEDPSRPD